MSNIITARGLRRTYGQGHDAFEAVKGIDLDVAEGEVFALLGTWRCGGEPAATRPLPMSSWSRSISPTAPVFGWDRSPAARNAAQTKATIYTYDLQLHLAEVLAWASAHGLRLNGLEARAATLESVFLDIATDPVDHSASTHDMIGAKSIGYCSTAELGRDRTVSDRTHWRRRPRLRQGFLTWLVNPQDQKELAGRAGKPVLVGSGGRSLPTDIDRTR